jgi:hypothetical protein
LDFYRGISKLKTNNMKLYTEEQVWVAINIALNGINQYYTPIIDRIKPIELPSDEEIEQRVTTLFGDVGMYQLYDKDRFIDGAKWLKEQILNQNK